MRIEEIHRELKDSDPRVRHYIQSLQEQILSVQEQLDVCASVLEKVVLTLQRVNRINLELNSRWERMRRGEPEELVESVLNEPEH